MLANVLATHTLSAPHFGLALRLLRKLALFCCTAGDIKACVNALRRPALDAVQRVALWDALVALKRAQLPSQDLPPASLFDMHAQNAGLALPATIPKLAWSYTFEFWLRLENVADGEATARGALAPQPLLMMANARGECVSIAFEGNILSVQLAELSKVKYPFAAKKW